MSTIRKDKIARLFYSRIDFESDSSNYFPLSKFYRDFFEIKKEIESKHKKVSPQSNVIHDLEAKKTAMIQSKHKIKEPVSDLLILFIQILLKDDFNNNLKSFEKCLFNSKQDILQTLRQERQHLLEK